MAPRLILILTILILASGCVLKREDGSRPWNPTTTSTSISTSTSSTITGPTSAPTTTTTTPAPQKEKPTCPPRRPCSPCTCQICTKCPSCTFEPTPSQTHKALNYKPGFGTSAYQSGGYDCKDFYLDLYDVPDRPKFRTRPSTGMPYWPDKPQPDKFLFKREDGRFTLDLNYFTILKHNDTTLRIYKKGWYNITKNKENLTEWTP